MRLPPSTGPPSTGACGRRTCEQHERNAKELPEEQRIAVTLMDLCGLSAAEVARATGSPRGTVLSRVHRGRKALAAHLGKEVRIREP